MADNEVYKGSDDNKVMDTFEKIPHCLVYMVKYNQYFFVASSMRNPSFPFFSAQQGMQEDLWRYFATGSNNFETAKSLLIPYFLVCII